MATKISAAVRNIGAYAEGIHWQKRDPMRLATTCLLQPWCG